MESSITLEKKNSALKEFLYAKVTYLIENGIAPDAFTRFCIRQLLKERLVELDILTKKNGVDAYVKSYAQFLAQSPLAIMTAEANEQHYEVPTEFYHLSLGTHKKYSSCYWDQSTKDLTEAEQKALDISIEHAEITDGMSVLEFGCGWGSLSLELAKRFPNSKITSISNSRTQKAYIDDQAKLRGLTNLTVLTRDLGKKENYDFQGQTFDRMMSIEMMEHIRNYDLFFKETARLLKDDGKFFVHIFTHRSTPYTYEIEGEDNWMGRYFFSGGQMPSRDLFKQFPNHLKVSKQWQWNGKHYQRTLEEWLIKLDQNKEYVHSLFAKTYGEDKANLWVNRWRIFYMACAELFGYEDGEIWGVTHYLLEKNK